MLVEVIGSMADTFLPRDIKISKPSSILKAEKTVSRILRSSALGTKMLVLLISFGRSKSTQSYANIQYLSLQCLKDFLPCRNELIMSSAAGNN